MNHVIGQCSNCGGDVLVPEVWGGVDKPRPTCNRCGATAMRPTIPMGAPTRTQEETIMRRIVDHKNATGGAKP